MNPFWGDERWGRGRGRPGGTSIPKCKTDTAISSARLRHLSRQNRYSPECKFKLGTNKKGWANVYWPRI